MGVLSHLEPREVFQYFEEICRIPHGSGHTQQISDYLVHFAKDQELKWQQDESGNVMIWKDGTAGYEQAPAAMLQGHIDMVCEKDPGCPLDMEKDPLMLREDGGMVTAEGTTLGGDDGIAVAYALTILASDSIPHPPLEAVFTVDEEIGMLGAAALDASLLKARYLLNIDSEDEGILLAGCAGGATAECSIPVKHAIFGGSEAIIKVEKGLGGHSGVDINRGRANASQVLGRALKALSEEADFRIVRIEGGKKDNAIPASSSAQLIVSGDAQIRQLIALIGRLNMALEKEYRLKKLRLLVFGGETVSDFGAVRLLTAADYPLYEEFFRSAYPGASPEGWLEEYFLEKAENGLFAGAEQDGRLVSVCDAPDMPYMEGLIQHTGIMTPEGYRRRGFARACCALETHHLLTLGICPQWECAADNEASYRLARSIGYEDYASAYIVED